MENSNIREFIFFRHVATKSSARTLFRDVRNFTDIEAGSFAFRKDVITHANLRPVGYKILLELLVQGSYNTVTEVGYTFGEREAGASKLGGCGPLELFSILRSY